MWRLVVFHCLLLMCVRPQPCVCMCACICVSTWFCEGTYSYVWFCTAEKWNQCSPRDSTILSLSTIKWDLQIKRVPHHVRPPHRPAVSVDECALFCSNSYTLALVAEITTILDSSLCMTCWQWQMLHTKKIKHSVRNSLLLRRLTCLCHSGISQPHASFERHSANILLLFSCDCWAYAVIGDWCKQIPDTRTGLSEAWVLPFKSSRKDLQWNYSGCFLSVQRHWKGGTVPVSSPLARGGVFFIIENCSTVWEHTEQIVWWAADWLIDDFVCHGVAKAARVLH